MALSRGNRRESPVRSDSVADTSTRDEDISRPSASAFATFPEQWQVKQQFQDRRIQSLALVSHGKRQVQDPRT